MFFLGVDEQKAERTKCFDLLDALTRTGALAVEDVQMHMIISHTHCFGKNVMDTLVKDNVNPIDSLEKSTLAIAEILLKMPKETLVLHK